MSTTVAAAQYSCIAGDLPANLVRHLACMQHAAQCQVDFLLFPELSLTGYEPEYAAELALAPDSAVLQPLRDQARRLGMTTVVGLPIRYTVGGVLIAALVLGADGQQRVYTKQHLHPGEDRVFSPGHGGTPVLLADQRIALAVCADFAHPKHVANAVAQGADLYAASVLVSENGYAHDSQILQDYALEHQVAVLMANHGGPSGGWACAGRSAFWAPGGALIIEAREGGDYLVLAQSGVQGWQGRLVEVVY